MFHSSLGRKLVSRTCAARRVALIASLFAFAALPYVNAGAWQQQKQVSRKKSDTVGNARINTRQSQKPATKVTFKPDDDNIRPLTVCSQNQLITPGTPINGTLTASDCNNPFPLADGRPDNSKIDEYTFTGNIQQQVTITLTSSAFDTVLYLLDANNNILAFNDDIDVNDTNSRISLFTLPATGTYSILANSFRPFPEEQGAYTLTLTSGATCSTSTIAYGDTKSGTLNASDCTNFIDEDGTPVELYTFNGTAGQQIAITMTATTPGNLDPYLYLLTPDGDLLADDDNGGGGSAARIPVGTGFGRLPSTGIYTIVVNTRLPSQSGNYSLTLTRAATDCASIPITVGSMTNGTLANGDCRLPEDGSFMDAYTFTGAANAQVMISMTSSTSGLVPVVFLLAPAGNTLLIDVNEDGGNVARIPFDGTATFTLPVTGTYTVLANSFQPNQTGNYTLALTRSVQQNAHTINGRITGGGVGLSGVTLSLSGGASATTTTDANGYYSFIEFAAGNSYTITPTNTAQYSFTPQTVAALQSDQTINFNGTLRTYTVDGRVTTGGTSLSGVTVTLSGAAGFTPRIVTTQAGGNYSFPGVPAGGNYTVTATKANYTFAPSNIAVANLLANRSGADFMGTLQTFSIGGRIMVGTNALAGVSIGLSGSTTGTTQTNANGDYSFIVPAGGTYTITPTVTNYTFAPASQVFNNLSSDQTANFTATLNTYTISGKVVTVSSNLGGVTLTLSGSLSATTTTDASGNYAFANLPAAGNYTVAATKLNYTFAPPSRTFTNLSGNQTASNFTATVNTYTISGRITGASDGLSGVTVSLSDAQAVTTTTDANGNYSFSVLAGGNYTVTPTLTNYTFAPASQVFNNLSSNQTGNFTGILNTYTISGQVAAGSTNLSGVTVTLSGSQSGTATTDASGNYSFSVTAGGTYTVTPAKAFYRFDAPNLTFASITTNQTANFNATLLTYTLSGRVSQGASGLPGVTLALSGDRNDTTTTDAQGNYSFSNLTGGSSVMVTPGRAHYTFAPPSQSINIDGERGGINFEATPVPNTIGFTSSGYQVSEGDGRATLTVTRTGDTSGAATVDYRITDTDTFTVGCFDAVNNQGGAFARCDFATTVGTLSFALNEASKQITVPIIDDGHAEESETFQLRLTNPSGAILGTPDVATVTITDNDASGTPNPILTHPFFVRQQYLDFLSREPDTEGFNAWLGLLNNCENAFNGPATPSGCDRIFVSGEGFFRSLEFQLKGFYVFRFYKAGFDRLPEYLEVVSDMSYVAGQTAEEVYARKAQLATRFTQRAEFQIAYAGMTNAQYVAALLGRYGLTQVRTPDPAQPDGSVKVTLTSAELTDKLDTNALTRAQVLRAIADSEAVGTAEFNNAFVGMQYYGYLRRKPDPSGFNAWLGVLQSGNVRTMVDGFLNSTEYKLRFGQP